jgi:dihydroorotate dehydrogenase electron transfer subunit
MRTDQLPLPYRISHVITENENTKTYLLEGHLEALPGQFVMVWLPGINEKPFSLADTNPIALTIARVGPFSEALHRLKAGDRLWLRGPFGAAFVPEQSPALLVGGGYGSAPLSFLARRLRVDGHMVFAALGARTESALLLTHRFENLGCAVHLATDDGSAGRAGLVTDLVQRMLEALDIATIYACGPNLMLDAVRLLAHQNDIPCQLSYEAYMRCGIGVCGSCTCGDRLICRDGPVLRTAEWHHTIQQPNGDNTT